MKNVDILFLGLFIGLIFVIIISTIVGIKSKKEYDEKQKNGGEK